MSARRRSRERSAEVAVRAATPDDIPQIYALIVALAVYEREPDAVTGTARRCSPTRCSVRGRSAEALIAEVDGEVGGVRGLPRNLLDLGVRARDLAGGSVRARRPPAPRRRLRAPLTPGEAGTGSRLPAAGMACPGLERVGSGVLRAARALSACPSGSFTACTARACSGWPAARLAAGPAEAADPRGVPARQASERGRERHRAAEALGVHGPHPEVDVVLGERDGDSQSSCPPGSTCVQSESVVARHTTS